MTWSLRGIQNGSGETPLPNRSGREDLNLRPQRPERCALTGLRYSPDRSKIPQPARISNAILNRQEQSVTTDSHELLPATPLRIIAYGHRFHRETRHARDGARPPGAL